MAVKPVQFMKAYFSIVCMVDGSSNFRKDLQSIKATAMMVVSFEGSLRAIRASQLEKEPLSKVMLVFQNALS